MLFLTLLGYLAMVIHIVFGIIGVAAALYYIAELVEEYTTLAKKVIWWLNFSVLVIFILLWIFENFPLMMMMFGIIAQVCHFLILQSFPFVTFLSPNFIITMVLEVVNHYFAFSYFTTVYHPFYEVITYFTICLWLVPFALFVSISTNDNILPTIAERKDDDSSYLPKRAKRHNMFFLFNYIKESLSKTTFGKSS